MGFRTYKTSVASAVATNGTFTFNVENASVWGQVKNEAGHQMYCEGLQTLFTSPAGFTMTASGATVTVTYLGTTAIPAGSVVQMQLELPGENNYLFDGKGQLEPREVGKDYLGNNRWATAKTVRLNLGAPSAAAAGTVVSAAARVGANLLTTYANAVVLDVPRVLKIVSSNAGDTTQTVTIRGTDEFGVAMTETISANGTTIVNGKKAFKTVISDTTSATFAGNLSIGQLATFGLPFFLAGGTGAGMGYVIKEATDGATPTAGTAAGGDLTNATATTGDVRGTWTPNTAADGAKVFEAVILATDVSFKGVPQFGG